MADTNIFLGKLLKWLIVTGSGWSMGVCLILIWENLKQVLIGHTQRIWYLLVKLFYIPLIGLIDLRIIWPAPLIPASFDSLLYTIASLGIAVAFTGQLWAERFDEYHDLDKHH